MSRGKAFICWLDHDGRANQVALHQGDPVKFRLKKRWLRGTIHCRRGKYTFRHREREFCVFFRSELRPVMEIDK